MDFKDLTNGPYTGQKVSTGNQQPSLLPREANTPPYKKGEATIKSVEPAEVFLPHGRRYAEKFGVKLALNLEQALNMRRQKLAVVTLREADTAARWGAPLDSNFMHLALQAMDGMIIEGIPGEKDNAYFLRERYNAGIEFKRRYYHQVDAQRQAAADKALADIAAKLAAVKLALWPEELNVGIAVELCKPEYMNWEQYRAASQRFITRDPAEFEDELHDQDSLTLGELASNAGDAALAGSH